jgi:hypothetical protein
MRDPKKGRTDLLERRVRRYEFIKKMSGEYPLYLLFEIAKVSRSAYYAWAGGKARRDLRQASIRVAVMEKFYFHKRTYGSKRLSDELKEDGLTVWTTRSKPN